MWRWNKWLKQPKLWWRLWAMPKPRLRAPLTWTTSGQCSKWVSWELRTWLSLLLELTSWRLTSKCIMAKRLRRGKARCGCCFLNNKYSKSFLESPSMMLGVCQHPPKAWALQSECLDWSPVTLVRLLSLSLFIICKMGTTTGLLWGLLGGLNDYSGKRYSFIVTAHFSGLRVSLPNENRWK